MTVYEFLRTRTFVKELCVIRDKGYIVMTAWIDYEDIFRIDICTGNAKVISDEWGTLATINRKGQIVKVDCHYIDI